MACFILKIKNQNKSLKESFDKNKLHSTIQQILQKYQKNFKPNITKILDDIEIGLPKQINFKDFVDYVCETIYYESIKNYQYEILAGNFFIHCLHKRAKLTYENWLKLFLKKKEIREHPRFIFLLRKYHKQYDKIINFDNDYGFDLMAIRTLSNGYLLRGNDGNIIETPNQCFMRYLIFLHEGNIEKIKDNYNYLSKKYYTPSTPSLFNAGLLHCQLSSCFLLDMVDDSIEGIYKTLEKCAKISKNAGGIGLAIHKIRGAGSKIKSTGRAASGILPMMKMFEDTAKFVNQGGKRQGSFAMFVF